MGQKVNPIGLRLGVHRKWNSNWYFDFNNYSKFIFLNFDIEQFFKGFLYYYPKKILLMDYQLIKLPSNKLYIFIFFYKMRIKKKKRKKNNNFLNTGLSYDLPNSIIDNNYKIINNKNFIEKNFLFMNLVDNKNNNQNFDLKIKTIQNLKQKNYSLLVNSIKNLNKVLILKNSDNNLPKLFFIKNKLYINNIKKLVELNLNLIENCYNLLITNQNLKYIKNKNKKQLINNINYKYKIYLKQINNNLNEINTIKNSITHNFILYFLNKNNKFVQNKYYFKSIINNINSKFIQNPNKLNYKQYINQKKYYKNNNIKNKLEIRNKNFYFKLKKIKKFISKFTNLKTSLIFVNSLSFAQFYYRLKRDNVKIVKNLNIISNIEKQMVNKFKYSTIYINDLITIAFISMLFKNPNFLVQFIAFQFKKLPRTKKQLKLIQLISQTIQTFGNELDEVEGIKLQFKGCINRRQRARTLTVRQGVIPLQSTLRRIEYGYSEGYTKKGLIGIKLWIAYNPNFKSKFRDSFLQYIEYSKQKNKLITDATTK